MKPSPRIALVEDDKILSEMMALWLQEGGYDCTSFEAGNLLIRQISRDSADLIIMDWMLPDTNGIELLRWVRQHINWPIPVIFVTGKDSEKDIVQALTEGADDYMTKPVQKLELLARVEAVIRRSMPRDEEQRQMDLGRYRIDLDTRSIFLDDKAIELTQKEFDLILFLFRCAGRVLARGHILESVWGRSPDVNTRTVDTHISRIRRKLQLKPVHGWQLKAVYQHGYRLERADIPAAGDVS